MRSRTTTFIGTMPKRAPAAHRLLASLRARLAGLAVFEMPNSNFHPAIAVRDLVFVDRKGFPDAPLRRHDIVLYRSAKHDGLELPGRVVGLPGERIELRDGVMHVNGVAIAEPFVTFADEAFSRSYESGLVPEGALVLMGDVRDGSEDSRQLGFVPTAAISAKVLGVAARSHAGLA